MKFRIHAVGSLRTRARSASRRDETHVLPFAPKFLKSLLAFSLLALLLTGCISLAEDVTPPPDYVSPTPPPTMGPLFPQTPPSLANGATIYNQNCAPCHGTSGQGDGPMASQLQNKPAALGSTELGHASAPADWFVTVTQGDMQNFMPPFSDSLSDQDRWDVVSYALSLSTTSDQLAQGKQIYQANCAKCHGDDGKLAKNADLTDQAAMAKLSMNDIFNFIQKGAGKMPAMSSLSEADTFAVAAYMRTLTYAPEEAAVAPTASPLPTSGSSATESPAASPAVSANATLPASDATALAEFTPTGNGAAATGTPGTIMGTVTGKITNGSGGNVPNGLKVTLHGYDHDVTNSQFNEVYTQEQNVQPDGSYSFGNLPLVVGRAYFASVDYDGTTYDSDPAMIDASTTQYSLPVTIYETTTDLSGLVADQVHLLFDFSTPNVAQVVEFYIISNPTTKTVIAANKNDPIVRISLPQDFSSLQFEQGQLGQRYVQTVDGFGDTQPVPPSNQQYQLVFAFQLPYTNNTLAFSQPLTIKTTQISVLVPEGVTASGQSLSDQGLQDIGNGTSYEIYNAGSFSIGQTVSLTVSGTPKQQSDTSSTAPIIGNDSTRNIIIGVGAFGMVLILAGVWLFWRDRRHGSTQELPDEEPAEAEASGDTDEIVDAIIALDDQFRAGNISEQAYKQRRAELKAALKAKL